MDGLGESETDASSIKPVSSLRSHFESMRGVANPVPSPILQRPPPIPAYIEPERGRSSLDIPRRGSPWNGSREFQDTERKPSPKPTTPVVGSRRNVDTTGSPRQRPVSMGPWSLPQTPLVLQVQPPRSPPKSISVSTVSAFVPKPTSVSTPTSASLASRPPPPIPQSRSPHRSPAPPPPKLLTAESSASPALGIKASQQGISQITMPPPINRAVKPNIGMKNNSSTQSGSPNLEPAKNRVEDKVSPFSTPPSSDGRPSPEDRTVKPVPEKYVSKTAPPSTNGGYFPPPPKHHVVGAKQEAQSGATAPISRTRDARSYGFTSSTIGQPGSPAQRPAGRDHQAPRTLSADRSKKPGLVNASQPNPTLPVRPRIASQTPRPSAEFLPPPKRNTVSATQSNPPIRSNPVSRPATVPLSRKSSSQSEMIDTYSRVNSGFDSSSELTAAPLSSSAYPDATSSNRRPPWTRSGKANIDTTYDTRHFDICSQYVCATGYLTKAWDVIAEKMILELSHGERDIKITAIAFKPGTNAEEEGKRVWLGSNYGDIQEVDLEMQKVTGLKPQAHGRREIVKIHRHQNSMWSLDEEGKLHVWLPDDHGLPNLQSMPVSHRIQKGHSFSLIVGGRLWHASGKELRIYRPGADGDDSFFVTKQPIVQSSAGEITSGATISSQLDRVYLGHTDGKVSIYSTNNFNCLGIVNVSVYKINTLAGAGVYLWAGYNTGMIYVYDTRTQPWQVKKEWLAHEGPVLNIITDRSSIWKLGYLHVASIGVDNSIKIWDGLLGDDWLEDDMRERDTEYCEFGEVTAVVTTWNAGASIPPSLRHDEKDTNFFREVIQTNDPPDIIVFGFQELVDLEDKKLTAKSLFMGNKKKDPSEQEHMSRQYRAWRDFLVHEIHDSMPRDQPYVLLHTASMVGLFSCIFVKESLKPHIDGIQAAEIKRGLGGFHGNKGALLIRFMLYDSSICFTNCHLAAGQTQTVHRNNDVAAILESASFPPERDPSKRIDSFIGGGDGCMIMDHEICILNGDLNYRIDTMGRDAVVKAIKMNDLARLLERDQLLVSRRRNPGFRLRSFNESPITFAPTYKYDVGTDNYDSSEKHRSPAWCDRILYRGVGRIKQLNYRRHDSIRASDHRPVSGVFKMRVKSISPKKRVIVWEQCKDRFVEAKKKMAKDIQIDYLISVLGVDPQEAMKLVDL